MAVIVMADADLDKAANCHSRRRLWLHRSALHGDVPGNCGPSIKDKLLSDWLKEHENQVGSDLDETVDMGPAVDEKTWKTDLDYLRIGGEEGARLGSAARSPKLQRLFRRADDFPTRGAHMRIFKEEIFGPVLSDARPRVSTKALQFANGVEYGLTTSIFTRMSIRL